MSMKNSCQFIGYLGKDPEVRMTPSGNKVANVNLAVTTKWTTPGGEKKEDTQWVPLVAWRQKAELFEKYLVKGSKIVVEGAWSTRTWDDANGVKQYKTEIKVNEIEFAGGKQAQASQLYNQGHSQGYQSQSYGQNGSPATNYTDPADMPEDDLPF